CASVGVDSDCGSIFCFIYYGLDSW
nr:immunoglobulin heavy chain junction region [Macaca mulatta]